MKGNKPIQVGACLAATLLLVLTAARAQTLVDLKRQSKSVDFSGANSTSPVRMGTILPSVCNAGEMLFKSDAPAGTNLYACVGTNLWVPLAALPAGMSGAQLSRSGNVLSMPLGICRGDYLVPYASPATITVSGGDTGVLYVGYDISCNRACYAGAGLTLSNYQASGFGGSACISGAPPATGFTGTGTAQVIAGSLQDPADTTPTVYVRQASWNNGDGLAPVSPPGYFQCLMDLCASSGGNGAGSSFQGSVREFAFVPRVNWFASRFTVEAVSGDAGGCSGAGCVLSLGVADSDGPHTLLAQANVSVPTAPSAATVVLAAPVALTAYHQYFIRMNTNSQAAFMVSGGAEVPALLNANAVRTGSCSTTVTNPGSAQTMPATCGTFTAAGSTSAVPLLIVE